MRYAMFDSDRRLAGFLLEGLNEIPPEAIPITDEFFFEMLAANELNTGFWRLNEDGVAIEQIPYSSIPPTPEQILAANQNKQNQLLNDASRAMAPVLVSLNLGDATDDETAIAKEWQAYYRALKLVDLSAASPDWPEPPAEF